MNAQAGWYDAGAPGRERWWDGEQWTAHERAALNAPAVPMGWFRVAGTADVRWWDGRAWTPHRIRDGKPRPDAFAIEPGNSGVVFGLVFILLGVTQFSTYSLSRQPIFVIAPALFFVAGVMWLIGGLRASQLKKLPAPATAPAFDAVVRPLPGEVEGAGAGWFPVSGRIARWWTGVRWTPYVAQKFGVRPTQYGPRSYRASMIVGGSLAGLGVLGTSFGFAALSVLGRWTAAAIIVPAVVIALAGIAVLLTIHLRRYTMILPPQPPLR